MGVSSLVVGSLSSDVCSASRKQVWQGTATAGFNRVVDDGVESLLTDTTIPIGMRRNGAFQCVVNATARGSGR